MADKMLIDSNWKQPYAINAGKNIGLAQNIENKWDKNEIIEFPDYFLKPLWDQIIFFSHSPADKIFFFKILQPPPKKSNGSPLTELE